MAASAQCPHNHPTITSGGPYYRQAHPNNFQDGRALSQASRNGNDRDQTSQAVHDGMTPRHSPHRRQPATLLDTLDGAQSVYYLGGVSPASSHPSPCSQTPTTSDITAWHNAGVTGSTMIDTTDSIHARLAPHTG